ncbi:sensor histidine kinase [Bacillus cereus]|nr:sensor histidine kinase [Bacillus cereus]
MYKLNKHNDSIYHVSDIISVSRIPIILWIILVYLGAMVLQYIGRPLFMKSMAFTLIILMHILFHLFSESFTKNQKWPYFLIQGVLIFVSAFLIPEGSPVVLIGLLPILIAQSITIFQSNLKVTIVFLIFYTFYCLAIGINYGAQKLPIFIPILFFILTIVIIYSVIYNRQVHARLRMEYYLQELELAHQKVEQLTLSNERQRMARDLHDTLAQGLAGLIMQLEAVNAHLHNGNTIRSQEIIQKSMQQARETLSAARKVIDDLRTKEVEDMDFYNLVIERIRRFKDATPIHVESNIEPIAPLSNLIKEHSLYIISECLTNVAKHSQAKNVKLLIEQINNHLIIVIEDNGIGFKVNSIDKYSGKYGLLGLNERVRLVGGEITINSTLGVGTTIYMTVPI